MSDRAIAACQAFVDYARDSGECAVCNHSAASCDEDYAEGEDCCAGAMARAAVRDDRVPASVAAATAAAAGEGGEVEVVPRPFLDELNEWMCRQPGVALGSEARTARLAGEPHVDVSLPGVLLVHEVEVSARALRHVLDKILERAGARKVSVVITSLEPL